jgi:hypothetical protein
VTAYLDDALVATKGCHKERLLNLEQFFEKLDTTNFCIDFETGTFAMQEYEYLGNLVAAAGIFPPPSNVDAKIQPKAPNTLKTLRSFLGLVNYTDTIDKGYKSTSYK